MPQILDGLQKLIFAGDNGGLDIAVAAHAIVEKERKTKAFCVFYSDCW
jgi:hypothetical protein